MKTTEIVKHYYLESEDTHMGALMMYYCKYYIPHSGIAYLNIDQKHCRLNQDTSSQYPLHRYLQCANTAHYARHGNSETSTQTKVAAKPTTPTSSWETIPIQQ